MILHKPGQYLLTGMLALMLVIAPLRAVMALSMSSVDHCMSAMNYAGEPQQPDQASTDQGSDHSVQAHDQCCCGDNDNTCTTDCHTCTSLSYTANVTLPVDIFWRHIPITGPIASAVPLHGIAPLLRPPATLHS